MSATPGIGDQQPTRVMPDPAALEYTRTALRRMPQSRLMMGSPTWTRTKTKGSKDPCAAITPWGKGECETRQVFIMPHISRSTCRGGVFSSIMAVIPARFPEWMPDFRPSTQGMHAKRRGIPCRDAPGKCRTVRRRNRPRTPRGWRWPAAARWKARSNHPNASHPESERCR